MPRIESNKIGSNKTQITINPINDKTAKNQIGFLVLGVLGLIMASTQIFGDTKEFVKMAKVVRTTGKGKETEQSWVFKLDDMDKTTCDLQPVNPNTPEAEPLRSPAEILENMKVLDEKTNAILLSLKDLI